MMGLAEGKQLAPQVTWHLRRFIAASLCSLISW